MIKKFKLFTTLLLFIPLKNLAFSKQNKQKCTLDVIKIENAI